MSQFGPVRKIGVQSRSITGTMPDSNRYESSLERDLMELLRCDPDFDRLHAQPVRVPLVDSTGTGDNVYTPDALVFWKSERRPWLVEVKYRADCVGLAKPLLRKFRAARLYAAERGWEFRVMTEDRIRSQKLTNLRFLTGYRMVAEQKDVSVAIRAALAAGRGTPAEVLFELDLGGFEKSEVVTQLWRMVANGVVTVDHERKLTMNVPLTLAPCAG